MKIVISDISGRHVFNIQAAIEKRNRSTSGSIAKIQLTTSTMLDEALQHTLETYTEVKTKYVQR